MSGVHCHVCASSTSVCALVCFRYCGEDSTAEKTVLRYLSFKLKMPGNPTISHLLTLLQAVTLLTCSLNPSPVCQLFYYATVLFKIIYCKIKNVCLIFVFDFYALFGCTVLYCNRFIVLFTQIMHKNQIQK